MENSDNGKKRVWGAEEREMHETVKQRRKDISSKAGLLMSKSVKLDQQAQQHLERRSCINLEVKDLRLQIKNLKNDTGFPNGDEKVSGEVHDDSGQKGEQLKKLDELCTKLERNEFLSAAEHFEAETKAMAAGHSRSMKGRVLKSAHLEDSFDVYSRFSPQRQNLLDAGREELREKEDTFETACDVKYLKLAVCLQKGLDRLHNKHKLAAADRKLLLEQFI